MEENLQALLEVKAKELILADARAKYPEAPARGYFFIDVHLDIVRQAVVARLAYGQKNWLNQYYEELLTVKPVGKGYGEQMGNAKKGRVDIFRL